VHALGQVASCRLQSTLDVGRLQGALNARLPADVRVLSVVEAPAAFHARYWARHKTYVYVILNGPIADPHARQLLWHLVPPLDVEAMRSALALLVGRHDFRAFQAAGSRVTDTTRTVSLANLDADVWTGIWGPGIDRFQARQPVAVPRPSLGSARADLKLPRMLTLTFAGDGFLRHMVRNIVGTVVEVGLGRRSAENVVEILAGCDRRAAGMTAPPHGLYLLAVEYREGPAD
jgi:tRNA pseudouridine38-40 synthase